MGWLNNSIGHPESDPTRGLSPLDPTVGSSRSPSPSEHVVESKSAADAQLISKLSSMEAAHLIQLHDLTSQMAERELFHKEETKNKDMELQQSHNRVTSVESRIRERDAQMSALKEEKAGFQRQIVDLKNQLYQLQFEVEETTSDKATDAHNYQARLNESGRELLEAKRALDDALQTQADAITKASELEKGNNELRRQLQANMGNTESEVLRLHQQLAELQSANSSLSTKIAEEKANTSKNKQLNLKEISELRSMLRARDDAIQGLQGRVEKGQDELAVMEAELNELRGDKEKLSGEKEDAVNSLQKENRQMSDLMEKQNNALKDLTAKQDRQKKEYEQQSLLAERRGAEIELLQSALKEGEEEKAASIVRSNSLSEQNHTRVTSLEVELQTLNEKVDELTSALNDAMEEIDDLQTDVVFKEGTITSLEKEIEETSGLLKARSGEGSSSPQSLPARLREEIAKIARERDQLKSEHSSQLSQLRASKDSEISKLVKDLDDFRSKLNKDLNDFRSQTASKDGDISGLIRDLHEARRQLAVESSEVAALKALLESSEKSRADISHELEKTREVMDQLDAEEDRELEEYKARVDELQLENQKWQHEVEDLNALLEGKEHELAQREAAAGEELREARQAMIAMDQERRAPSRDRDDDDSEKTKAEKKAMNDQLAAFKERVRTSEAKLNCTVQEKELAISDLKSELASKEKYLGELKDEVESLQLSVERGPSRRNYGMSIDPEWHEPDNVSKLKAQLSTLGKQKRMVEGELRAKIDARDATIATLVLSSSNQEANITELNFEINRLQAVVDSKSSSESYASEQRRGVDADRRREVERLRETTHDLTIELKQTKRRLTLVTEELDCARSQLAETDALPDVQDLAGRLVISEQAQKILMTENSDKLKERDAAIANLLQSMQANEGVIANLRADVERFKSQLNESIEENRQLQHESKTFAAQIIDQDEEFKSYSTKLKEKSSEIASLKREIASRSAEVRNVERLERQLDELREEKRTSMGRINKLEAEIRDVEMKRGEEVGFEAERLKLELQNVVDDKKAMEERLNKQIDSLRKLRNHAVEDFESKLRERDNQIASLEKELLHLREKVLDDDMDDIFLDDNGGGKSKKELLEEREMLLLKIEALGEEMESLRVPKDSDALSQLRSKLAQSEKLREELEEDRSSFHSSNHKEMDRLRVQLSDMREAHTQRELEHSSLLKKLEGENNEIRDDFAVRMKEKNARIVALEQTLAAQEQVVGNMSSEMDQLQNGMEKISVQRRAEIEELQQELMDYTSKATRLEREVVALSMRLDEKRMKHRAETAKLRDRIATLESETPMERIARRDDHDVRSRESELEEKNDHLKWLNTSLTDENQKLKEKNDHLKKAISKVKKEETPLPKSAKNNDKWRNVALQEQVAVLSQRVIELEEAASGASAKATQNGRPPQSPRPSILHSPGMQSSLAEGSPNGATRSSLPPKSVLRVSTYENDSNQANDLLANPDNERPPLNPRTAGISPPLPCPTPGSKTPKYYEKSKSDSSKPSSRFSFRKRSGKGRLPSPKFDDASNSTTDYDF